MRADHDPWIVGDGLDEHGRRTEYIVHTRFPRFIAVLADEEAGEDTGVLSGGYDYDIGDGTMLCRIDWIDGVPTEETARLLFEEAERFLARVEEFDDV